MVQQKKYTRCKIVELHQEYFCIINVHTCHVYIINYSRWYDNYALVVVLILQGNAIHKLGSDNVVFHIVHYLFIFQCYDASASTMLLHVT